MAAQVVGPVAPEVDPVAPEFGLVAPEVGSANAEVEAVVSAIGVAPVVVRPERKRHVSRFRRGASR